MHRAFRKYPMLRDGDKIAVAVSGGHDSLSLLNLLHVRQPIVPERYDITAIHILGGPDGPEGCIVHKPLLGWLENSGIKYIIQPMMIAEGEKLPMDCPRCTWNRRSTLFRISNRLGCNRIAFGHHFDDIVDTALLNLFYQGRMATMYPYASYFRGLFALIRPLMYITKAEIEDYAISRGFPDPPPLCPNSLISQRKVVTEIFSVFKKEQANRIRNNVFRAVIECMDIKEELKEKREKSNGSQS